MTNPYTNLSLYTLDNIYSVFDSMYNRAFEEPYIKEQAAERMSKCLDAGSGCIRKITTFSKKDIPNTDTSKEYKEEDYIPTTTYNFSQCESCGCHAPHLFYAKIKTCRNKDNSIKWGPMLEEKEWEAYKKEHKLFNYAESNSESRHTDGEPEPSSSIQLEDREDREGANGRSDSPVSQSISGRE